MAWLLLLLVTSAGAADVEAGRALYVAKCQACHGLQGKGDGPATVALPSPPPDFTKAVFWQGKTDDKLEAVVTSGSPSGVMRGFPMKAEQLDSLVAYLRTFQPAP